MRPRSQVSVPFASESLQAAGNTSGGWCGCEWSAFVTNEPDLSDICFLLKYKVIISKSVPKHLSSGSASDSVRCHEVVWGFAQI